jgi:heparan-alpha-glucosaminide N-acetyltransferase
MPYDAVHDTNSRPTRLDSSAVHRSRGQEETMNTTLGAQPESATVKSQELSAAKPARLLSLDAYRGAIMLLMASSGLGLAEVARHFPSGKAWQILGHHADHASWTGCTLWDLIQPAFMFMVGVAMPWSLANRRARGAGFGQMLGHASWRSVILVLLAVFLSSTGDRQTDWSFTNVLAQIGLGYTFLFLVAFAKPRIQWLLALGILVGYWLVFCLYPLPPANFDWARVGIGPDWPRLSGFAAHWEKNANAAAAFDQWFLNLFPRERPFLFNGGGYQTLNFVPSLATMIFGLLTGQLMRSPLTLTQKLKRLLVFGLAGILLGQAIALAGLCPMVKRIWTPSWTLYSGGWVVLLLAGFVALIDWRGWKGWAFPLIVAGLNPITLYFMWQLLVEFTIETIQRHFGPHIFESLGTVYAPILAHFTVLTIFWLVLLWMYRRKLFLRI